MKKQKDRKWLLKKWLEVLKKSRYKKVVPHRLYPRSELCLPGILGETEDKQKK